MTGSKHTVSVIWNKKSGERRGAALELLKISKKVEYTEKHKGEILNRCQSHTLSGENCVTPYNTL